ncbi:MAG: malto-oligosyltrehalose trehalohydrolase [Isosphaeraceae bacterium]
MNERPQLGAVPLMEGGVRFRVWAPNCRRVDVVLHSEATPTGATRNRPALEFPMQSEPDGYFTVDVEAARVGDDYGYRLDGQKVYPDPASRFQPAGPLGPSRIIDPSAFEWTDREWTGVTIAGQVIYEIHIGTFTEEGTWRAARRELPRLADLGVSLLEIMPVAACAGQFNWGYDNVALYAPSAWYGTPDDFRSFVNEAHRLGIGVILDVVYNHLGPKGDILIVFADAYRSGRNQTEWGVGFDFDGPGSGPVRDYFLQNAAYWIREFHLDGFRLDALQEFYDTSDEHIIASLVRRARESAEGRSLLIIGEDEPQEARMVRSAESGGFGLDALWNDDFHHVTVGLLTRRVEAYYSDYHATPQEIVSLWKHGYLYQGQRNVRQGKPRGMPARGLQPAVFVNYLENHDQVANSLRGERLHRLTNPALYRAVTALLLLAPGTPMLFQGQEFASPRPFHYFNDAGADEIPSPRESRIRFLSQFQSLDTEEARAAVLDPTRVETFNASKLEAADRVARPEIIALHRDLIRLRRDDPTFSLQGSLGVDGAVLGRDALVLRHFGHDCDDRLIVTNLGKDFLYTPISEPLLAPPEGREWHLHWSSEAVTYHGDGTPTTLTDAGWWLPRHSTLVFAAEPNSQVASHE